MIEKIVKTLQSLLKLNQATEALLIDVIASYSPWLAPLIPAYMTYQHMTNNLDFPSWAAMAGGVVVETLGLSSVQTAVSFWAWNDSKAKSAPRAPLALAVLTGAFYLATVLTVNAMLDPAPVIHRVAKALLSSLSVCAGVILALRAGHARRINETERARAEAKQERAAARAAKRPAQVLPPLPQSTPGGNGRRAGIGELTR
jgi:hypothetical protein